MLDIVIFITDVFFFIVDTVFDFFFFKDAPGKAWKVLWYRIGRAVLVLLGFIFLFVSKILGVALLITGFALEIVCDRIFFDHLKQRNR